MKHVARILGVAIPVLIAACSTALATPAVTNFLEQHPGAAAYVALAAGALRAAWKAYSERGTAA